MPSLEAMASLKPISMDYHLPLEKGCYYHIYNRGNNGDNIFYTPENYSYFLKRFDYYLSDYLEVYAYCLLPNHFHFLVRVKDEFDSSGVSFDKTIPSLEANCTSEKRSSTSSRSGTSGQRTSERALIKGLKNLTGTSDIISELFRRLFTSYAKAINKQQTRTGSLFQKNFKRKKVISDTYFTQLVYYIHANPKLHGINDTYQEYAYSSYGRILSEKPSKLIKQYVIGWFGDKENYIQYHQQQNIFLKYE
jgi:REP element-mobilizing transposase RayT